MVLKHHSFVYCVREFPIGCGPTPIDYNHHNSKEDDEDHDVVEGDLDVETEDGPMKNAGSGLESGRTKRKAPAVRDFPPGCGCQELGQAEPEYPDWFDEIDFEEEIVAGKVEEEDSVSQPPSDPTGGGSDTHGGRLESKEVPGIESGFEDEPVAKRRKSLALPQQVEQSVIVLGLMASQFCPWRDSKGRLKKRSSALIKFS